MSITFGYSQITFKEVCTREDLVDDKIIFVHLHTDWCGLCKLMERTVYSDPEVSSFHNEHFVNLSWNPELYLEKEAKRREVSSFPTYLYIVNDTIIYRYGGALKKKEFLDMSKRIIELKDKGLSKVEMAKSFKNIDYHGRNLIANDSMAVLSLKEEITREEIGFLIDQITRVRPDLLLSVTKKIASEPLTFKERHTLKNNLMALYSNYLKKYKDEKKRADILELMRSIPENISPGI